MENDQENAQDMTQEDEQAFQDAFDIPVGAGQITAGTVGEPRSYQERVVIEREQLADKVEKLTDFLNRPEPPEGMDLTDRGLLVKQLDIMRRYASVLNQRIARF